MKKVDIDESGSLYWKISIAPDKRQELADLLNKQDIIVWVTVNESESDVISCSISNRAEESDRVILRELIERMAGGESKSERHPILNEKFVWKPDRVFSVRYKNNIGNHVYFSVLYGQVAAYVPDLLRELEQHLSLDKVSGSNPSHERLTKILADMGITFSK